jgi:hypothetical protein
LFLGKLYTSGTLLLPGHTEDRLLPEFVVGVLATV